MKHWKERNGKIYARFTYTDSTGKRREVWEQAESKTDAKDRVRDLEQKHKRAPESFEFRGTLEEYLDKWLVSSKQNVGGRTYQDYLNILRLHVRPALGKKKLSKMRPLHIQEMVDALKDKGLAPRTVRHAHEILYRALAQAVKWGVLATNPAGAVNLPKQIRREMKCFTPKEAARFLDACEGTRFGLVFELALISGMRPEEYLALTWGDLDFQKNTVTVQRVIVWERWTKEKYFAEPKTNKSRRTIPLPPYLMKKLKTHRRAQLEYKMARGEKYKNEHNLVFTSEVGTFVSLHNLQRRQFKPLLTKAKVPEIRLYDLRHSCATLLLAAGENPKVVAERLGHANIVLTLQTYTHVLPNMQQQATKRLAAILKR
jgi:integrase